MLENLPTGESCFFCGMPRYADDEAYKVTLHMDTYVSDCGGCPR